MSPYLFILYSIWVHVESPRYKPMCLESSKSSEFAIFFNKKRACSNLSPNNVEHSNDLHKVSLKCKS